MSNNNTLAESPGDASSQEALDVTVMERIKRLERLYLEKVHPLVQRYYSTLKSNFTGVEPKENELVGLLTFPNSGTSWFLQFSRISTGIYIHSVYEQEAKQANGCPNRDVFMLRTANPKSGRPPEPQEPVLVKSHVAEYGEYPTDAIDLSKQEEVADQWMKNLPVNTHRHIRLVRNPLDNLRARYHLYRKINRHLPEEECQSFRDYFKNDLIRYFLWHSYCNKLAEQQPVMTVCYTDMVNNTRFEFMRALQFAGCNVGHEDVERAFMRLPPKYKEENGVPVHLLHYSENDIAWFADQLRKWLNGT